MKKQPAKQYVIYSRKSKFTGKGESIENQIELCRQYIASHYGAEQAEFMKMKDFPAVIWSVLNLKR